MSEKLLDQKKGYHLKIDLEKKCVRDVGKALRSKKGYHLVVIKSTIIPTTTEKS